MEGEGRAWRLVAQYAYIGIDGCREGMSMMAAATLSEPHSMPRKRLCDLHATSMLRLCYVYAMLALYIRLVFVCTVVDGCRGSGRMVRPRDRVFEVLRDGRQRVLLESLHLENRLEPRHLAHPGMRHLDSA